MLPYLDDPDFAFVEESINLLSEYKKGVCARCLHKERGEKCWGCLVYDKEKNNMELKNFFPCPNFTREEILDKMSVKDIKQYLSSRVHIMGEE